MIGYHTIFVALVRQHIMVGTHGRGSPYCMAGSERGRAKG
jgi:hypothetical protein